MIRVPIYNYELPKHPRIFDVVVNRNGKIMRYETQNIKGCVYVDEEEVQKQISVYLKKSYREVS